jgi:hypothetical protein
VKTKVVMRIDDDLLDNYSSRFITRQVVNYLVKQFVDQHNTWEICRDRARLDTIAVDALYVGWSHVLKVLINEPGCVYEERKLVYRVYTSVPSIKEFGYSKNEVLDRVLYTIGVIHQRGLHSLPNLLVRLTAFLQILIFFSCVFLLKIANFEAVEIENVTWHGFY